MKVRRSTIRSAALRVALLAGAAGVVALASATGAADSAGRIVASHPAGVAMAAFAGVLGVFALAMNIVRLVLVMAYRPVPRPPDEQLPSLTVIVPAYNEGRFVRETLRSIAASRYPAGRLQIIAVDDGSTDDTWLHIRQAANELPGVLAIRCTSNRGKRHALHEGIIRATGQVIVTIDSDSVIERDTLANLVAPLAADPQVGAVAGNVGVLNAEDGLIPRLLSVAFVAAFDFSRAAESVLDAVLCTPGALAAYRTECVRPVLEQWVNQRYLGRPANIGEDRALTNLILAQGRTVKFQSNARVLTKAPTRLSGLRRMFTRWLAATSASQSPSPGSASPRPRREGL
jgi:hyaluronan synthase